MLILWEEGIPPERRTLKIRVRLYGVFRTAAGSANIQLDVQSATPVVRTAIDSLASHAEYRALAHLLLSEHSQDPRPNALIMVSGKEISSMNGLETPLHESDEVSLLPVAHGG